MLATSAAGLDPNRGDILEVINMQFSKEFATIPEKERPFGWIQDELHRIAQSAIIGIVVILVLLLVIRPVLMRSLEARREIEIEELGLQEVIHNIEEEAVEAQKAEEDAVMDLGLQNMEDKRISGILKQVNELVEKHPDETISILRNWMYAADQ